MSLYKDKFYKVEYFTEVEIEKISDEERAKRRKKALISDIKDIILCADTLNDKELEKRIENALMLYFY
ncbi:MAG: hypothetical protein E7391_00940 [Ruminococcaceae bacterium]|nr:hypothetical protein [Oscillospiraceae bacterium]